MKGLRIVLLSVSCLCAVSAVTAQTQWTLAECVDAAMRNNLRLRQVGVESEKVKLQLDDARNSRLPNLSASLNGNLYFGRGPTRDGTYSDNNQFSSGAGLSSDMVLFGGGAINHSIEAARIDVQTSQQVIANVGENISLQIMTAYLQVLYTMDMVELGRAQVDITSQLVETNEIKFKAGKIAESTLYESRSQLARDRNALVGYESDYRLALLDLQQMMNIEPDSRFEIRRPQMGDVEFEMMSRFGAPEDVYDASVGLRPGIRAEMSRLESGEKRVLMAKAQRYPTVSLGMGYNNSYYYSFQNGYDNVRFATQLRNNGNEYVGVNVSIPIWERGTIKNKIRSASLAVSSQQLVVEEAHNTYRKEIEQAGEKARTSYEKYLSSGEAARAAGIVFHNEQSKLDAGATTMFDYNNAKSQWERAQIEVVQAKYDYLFRCRILGFYLGEPVDFRY